MFQGLAKYGEFLADTWENIPAVRAAGYVGAVIAGLVLLNAELPDEFSLDLSETRIRDYSLWIIVIIYFFLVSIFAGDRLRFERKMRALEQNFKYDNRGTLYNGSEPNIAFRVTTFKSMISGLATALGDDTASDVLVKVGREASLDFARSLQGIYDGDVAERKAKTRWVNLSLAEKLDQWADYDSATGWGILACSIDKRHKVKVVINHLEGLFEGEDGIYFGHFLAGYSETIISTTVNDHAEGKYGEFSGCELLTTHLSDKYTLELEYKLK